MTHQERLRVARNTIGLVLVSFALASGGAKPPPDFELASFRADPGAVSEAFTSIDREKDVAKMTRVFVPSFQVEFITESSASASSYSMASNRGSTSTNVSYSLQGLADAGLQDVTDSLYEQLLRELEGAGFEVVPREQYEQSEGWQRLLAKAEASPLEAKARVEPGSGRSLVLAPSGMGIYYTQTDPKIGLVGAFKNVGAINKGENAGSFEGMLMESLDATMVKARVVVGFAQTETKGGLGDGSKVSASWRFSVAAGTTELLLVDEFRKNKAPFAKAHVYQPRVDKAARVKLSKAVFSPAPFVRDVRDVTSTGSRVAEGVGNAMSMLSAFQGFGKGHTSKRRVYEVDIDPSVYRVSSEDYIGTVMSMLSQRLKTVH